MTTLGILWAHSTKIYLCHSPCSVEIPSYMRHLTLLISGPFQQRKELFHPRVRQLWLVEAVKAKPYFSKLRRSKTRTVRAPLLSRILSIHASFLLQFTARVPLTKTNAAMQLSLPMRVLPLNLWSLDSPCTI